jgi:hydrogenase large subunit
VTQLPTQEQVGLFRKLFDEGVRFVKDVYFKDVLAVGTGPLFPLAQSGFGKGHTNYLAYGAFPQKDGNKGLLLTPGVITGDLTKVGKFDQKRIRESVKHSWYVEAPPAHPYEGAQEVDRDKADAYTFVKAPRYDGKPYEVGPLARMLVMRNKDLLGLVEKGAQPGVVARHASRAIESVIIADAMAGWIDELEAEMRKPGFRIHDTAHWDVPDKGEGAGFYDAPRGALGHWIQIEGGKTKRYQAVVPSTWNASPRDEQGIRGQYEESLIGIPIPDPENPINIVRVIRSFDPCLACAIHMIHPESNRVERFVIDPTFGV